LKNATLLFGQGVPKAGENIIKTGKSPKLEKTLLKWVKKKVRNSEN